MDGWLIALFAFAVYLAIRTLVQLMKAYERDYRRKFAREQAAIAKKPAPKPADAQPAR